MPIDPYIALQGKTPNLMQAISGVLAAGEEIRNGGLRRALMEQQQTQQQQAIQSQEVQAAKAKVVLSGQMAQVLKGVPPEQRDAALLKMNEQLGGAFSLEELAQAGVDDQSLDQYINIAQSLMPKDQAGKFSATTENLPGGLTVQTTTTGQKVVSDITGNILTGEDAIDAERQAREIELQRRRDIADIDVEEARQREITGQEARRSSEFIKEISTRNREAARDGRRIREALQLSSRAADGVTGGLKLKLSRLFPNIDVTDEAALDAALTQISLDQLQKFKGPTTDFEYGVTQNISSTVTDPKTARKAKLKALERSAWFNDREYKQFINHQKSGETADTFSFDFNEQVKTKKGTYSLKDLQDTAVANNMSIEDVLSALNKGK